MIETIMSVLGVVGAALCVLAYFLLEREKVSAEGYVYYAMNGVGATLVLLAAFWSYDNGDLGVIIQELFWVAISAMGILKGLSKRGGRVG